MSVKSSILAQLFRWKNRFAYCVQVAWTPEDNADSVVHTTLGVQRVLPLWLPGQRVQLLRWVQGLVAQPKALIVTITYLGVHPVAPAVQFENRVPAAPVTTVNTMPPMQPRCTEHNVMVHITPAEASDPYAIPGMQHKWEVPAGPLTISAVPPYLKSRVDYKRDIDGDVRLPYRFVLITDNGAKVDLHAGDVVRVTRVAGWAAKPIPVVEEPNPRLGDDPLTELPAAPRASVFGITAPAPRGCTFAESTQPAEPKTWTVPTTYRDHAIPSWLRGRILRPCKPKEACTLVCDSGELMGLYAGDIVKLTFTETLPPARYRAGDTVVLHDTPDRTYGSIRAKVRAGEPYTVIAGPYGYGLHNEHMYTLQHRMGGCCFNDIRESSLYMYRDDAGEQESPQ